MPGNNPPSAIPSNARTVTNDAKFRTNPRHMVRQPHTAVRRGSQILGDIFFSTRLEGSSLPLRQPLDKSRHLKHSIPRDIRRIKHAQPNRILMICDMDVFL